MPSPVKSAQPDAPIGEGHVGNSDSALRATSGSGSSPRRGSLKKHSRRAPDRIASVTPSPSGRPAVAPDPPARTRCHRETLEGPPVPPDRRAQREVPGDRATGSRAGRGDHRRWHRQVARRSPSRTPAGASGSGRGDVELAAAKIAPVARRAIQLEGCGKTRCPKRSTSSRSGSASEREGRRRRSGREAAALGLESVYRKSSSGSDSAASPSCPLTRTSARSERAVRASGVRARPDMRGRMCPDSTLQRGRSRCARRCTITAQPSRMFKFLSRRRNGSGRLGVV